MFSDFSEKVQQYPRQLSGIIIIYTLSTLEEH
jgi:hypothetical protein